MLLAAGSQQGVNNRNKENRHMGKPQKRNQELALKAIDLYKQGISGNEIATRFGLSPPTVYRMLKDAGAYVPGWEAPKPEKRKLSGEALQQFITEYRAGIPAPDLMEKYNIGEWAMREALSRSEEPKRRLPRGSSRPVTREERLEAVRLHSEGKNQHQIALKLKRAQATVSKILVQEGILVAPEKRGDAHPGWVGGLVKTSGGYMKCLVSLNDRIAGPMRSSSGYVLQHRLVMAQHLGRPLEPYETVHHINGDTADNRLENLQLRSGHHGRGVAMGCLDCGGHNVVATPIRDHLEEDPVS